MGPIHRVILLAVTAGCGGPEFVTGASGDAAPETGGPIDSGGETDAAMPDAGDHDGAMPHDSGTTNDGAPPPSDGAGPPLDAGDAAAGPFSCATVTGNSVLFCADFDEGTPSPWGWDSDPTYNGGTNTLDMTTYLSPPASYAAKTPALIPTAMTSVASLGKSVSSSANTLTYAFQLLVKQFDITGSTASQAVPVAGLTVGPTTAQYESFTLLVSSKGFQLQTTVPSADGGQQVQTVPTSVTSVAANTWVRVELALKRGTSPWTFTVTLDNGLALTTQPPTSPSDTAVQIQLGILDVTPPSGGDTIDFDNVILRGLP
jgi:hypothetical protein